MFLLLIFMNVKYFVVTDYQNNAYSKLYSGDNLFIY